MLLALGVALDLTAWAEFRTTYVAHAAGVLVAPWLLLWLGWQVLVVAALVRHRRPWLRHRPEVARRLMPRRH